MSYVCKFHNVFYFNLQAKKFDSDVGVSDSDLESLDDDLHENVNETDKGEDSDFGLFISCCSGKPFANSVTMV